MSRERVVTVTAGAAGALVRGHPWIWRQGVAGASTGLATGDVVAIRDPGGKALGQGLWDAASPIAVRVYTRSTSKFLDASAIVASVERAMARRDYGTDDQRTSAYRLCNGEGDRVPGVVIDRYDWAAVLRLDGDAIMAWLSALVDGVWPLLRERGIRSLSHRVARDPGDERLRPLAGDAFPETITVEENGIAMVVDLARGQKTGAFLDQRDNRGRVRELAGGRRVLNLFSYAGGFSTAAVLGGALHVTSVDIAQPAHATAQLSMRANGIDPEAHTFVTADAFTFLASAKTKGQRWDLIVSDPPSFAPNEKTKARALSSYRKLHAACAAVLAPDGIFCAASCSSHIQAEEFAATLDDVAIGRSDILLLEMFGLPADHPTLPAWPEGRYLKFAVLR